MSCLALLGYRPIAAGIKKWDVFETGIFCQLPMLEIAKVCRFESRGRSHKRNSELS